MYKFIVTWCLLINAEIPHDPKPDKFGRATDIEVTVISTCEPHVREFYNRDSALTLYRECKRENDIRGVGFDSVVRGE